MKIKINKEKIEVMKSMGPIIQILYDFTLKNNSAIMSITRNYNNDIIHIEGVLMADDKKIFDVIIESKYFDIIDGEGRQQK